jgi:hypothetical protein
MAKISNKKPAMFFQPGNPDLPDDLLHGARIRIFYPDGKVEWASFWKMHSEDESESYFFSAKPCWFDINHNEEDGTFTRRTPPKSMKEAISRARKYDREHGFPTMKLVSEL